MRKSANRKVRPVWCPPLVACHIYQDEADLQNHMRLERLRTGAATAHDFNWLLDTQSALLLGAHRAKDASALKAALIAQEVFKSMRARHERTGKFGCTGDEFALLCSMLEISEAWWPVQTADTLIYAHNALDAARMGSNAEAVTEAA